MREAKKGEERERERESKSNRGKKKEEGARVFQGGSAYYYSPSIKLSGKGFMPALKSNCSEQSA